MVMRTDHPFLYALVVLLITRIFAVTGNCVNTDDSCDFWADNGECEANAVWMTNNCAQSCGCPQESGDDDEEHGDDGEKGCDGSTVGEGCEGSGDTGDSLPQQDPDNCVNLQEGESLCESWAENNECKKNPGYMLVFCARSCNPDCPTPTEPEVVLCENKRILCSEWQSYGECENNVEFMLPNCPLSCNSACQPKVPGPPTNVQAGAESSSAVCLEVSPPANDGGRRVNGYRVEYGDVVISHDSTQLPVEICIVNLEPGSTSVFRVSATNEVGYGQALIFTHTMTSSQALNPVQMDESAKLGTEASDFRLTWSVPGTTPWTTITQYEIRYRMVSVFIGSFELDQVLEDFSTLRVFPSDLTKQGNAATFSYTLTDLIVDSYYQVEVLYRNQLGVSPPNEQYIFLTGSAGTTVFEMTSRTTLLKLMTESALSSTAIMMTSDITTAAPTTMATTMASPGDTTITTQGPTSRATSATTTSETATTTTTMAPTTSTSITPTMTTPTTTTTTTSATTSKPLTGEEVRCQQNQCVEGRCTSPDLYDYVDGMNYRCICRPGWVSLYCSVEQAGACDWCMEMDGLCVTTLSNTEGTYCYNRTSLALIPHSAK